MSTTPSRCFKYAALSLIVTCLLLTVISGHCRAAQVTLAWDASYDPEVAGYKLYSGEASRAYGNPVDVGNVTRYTVTGIPDAITLYFAVTAYDAKGNESAFSEELVCFTLVPSAGLNGAVSPANTVVVSRGMSQTFVFTPDNKFEVSDVRVDGVSVGPVGTYTFASVESHHTIYAGFVRIPQYGSLSSFNEDAKPDLLWRNITTGEIVVLFMNNASCTGGAYLPPVADPSWAIAGTADFNGDGNADILWRNNWSGENRIWYMNGAVLRG